MSHPKGRKYEPGRCLAENGGIITIAILILKFFYIIYLLFFYLHAPGIRMMFGILKAKSRSVQSERDTLCTALNAEML